MLFTEMIWTSELEETEVEINGIVISCGEYDSSKKGYKYCLVLDDPDELSDLDSKCGDGLHNFYTYDGREDCIHIISTLTLDEAYTHPNEYIRLTAKAIELGIEPLEYINEYKENF